LRRLILGCLVVAASLSAGLAAEDLVAARVQGEIPLDATWVQWSRARPRVVKLSAQLIAKPTNPHPSVQKVTVRALHNGNSIGFLLEWKDATRNVLVRETTFTDACAVEVPLAADPTIPYFMGAPGKRVMIMHWKAMWQEGLVDLQRLYPNARIDWYPFGDKGWDTQAGWEYARTYLPGFAAGNPISAPVHPSCAEELYAEGFGTLATSQHQNVRARGTWSGKTWRVVLVRPFKGEKGSNDPAWGPGGKTLVNFAIWDGAHQERDSRKAIYPGWIPLVLE
jgi:hypothetical protein